MKRLFVVLGLLMSTSAAYAWFPSWIENNSKYQGDNSVLNIASGTIRDFHTSTFTATSIEGTSSKTTLSTNTVVIGSFTVFGAFKLSDLLVSNYSSSIGIRVTTSTTFTQNLTLTGGTFTSNDLTYLSNTTYISGASASFNLLDDKCITFGDDGDVRMKWMATPQIFRIFDVADSTIATISNLNTTYSSVDLYTRIGLLSQSAAQLQASTPTVVGQMVWNTSVSKIFVSTGIVACGSWAASDSYTTGP
jgi:hypothetical protein